LKRGYIGSSDDYVLLVLEGEGRKMSKGNAKKIDKRRSSYGVGSGMLKGGVCI